MPQLLPPPRFQALKVSASGALVPLVGGKVWTYTAGTSTPKDSYTSYSMGAENTNPVILDARGEASIWLDGAYKIRLTDEDDNILWEQDDVRDLTGNQSFADATLAGTLTITSTAVTWSGNPAHSGNHTFSGNVAFNGNVDIGNAASDDVTIAADAVTWSNDPTHSGDHTFSGDVDIDGDVTLGGTTTLTPPSGSFAPRLTFGGAAVGMVFAETPYGQHMQIGDWVFFDIGMRLFEKGSSTGTALITGLPFPVGALSSSCLSIMTVGMSSLTGPPVAFPSNSATTIDIGYTSTTSSGAQTLMTDSNFTDSSIVVISGSYRR